MPTAQAGDCAVERLCRHAAGAAVTAPASRNSHAISRSVHAVTTAMTTQMDQSSTLRPSVSFVNF